MAEEGSSFTTQVDAATPTEFVKVVTVQAAEGKQQAVVDVLAAIRKTAVASGQCVGYMLLKCEGEKVVEVERWASQEAHDEWAEKTMRPMVQDLGLVALTTGFEDIARGRVGEERDVNTPNAAAVRVQALWRRARARGKYAGLLYDALLQREAKADHAEEEAQEAHFRRQKTAEDLMETLQARHSINRADIESAALGQEAARAPLARGMSANQGLMAAMLHQAQLGDGDVVVPLTSRGQPSTTPVPAPIAPVPPGTGVRRAVLSRINSRPSMPTPSPAAALLRRALSGGSLRGHVAPPTPPGAAVAPPTMPGGGV